MSVARFEKTCEQDDGEDWIFKKETKDKWTILGKVYFTPHEITIREYPVALSLTLLIHIAGTVEGGILAIIMERDPKAWAIGFDYRLLAPVYTGVVCSGIAYFVKGAGCIRRRGPLFAVAFSPLCMIITSIFGSILLSEQLHLGSLLGAIIIVLGFYTVVCGGRIHYVIRSNIIGVAQELPIITNQAVTIDEPTIVIIMDTTMPQLL